MRARARSTHERGNGCGRAHREGWRQRGTYGTISRLRKRFCQLYVAAGAHGRIARALQSASVPPNRPIPTTPGRSSSRSHHGAIVCSAVHAVCHHSRRWRRMPSEFRHEARGFSIEVSGGGGLGGEDERDGARAFAGGAGAVEAARRGGGGRANFRRALRCSCLEKLQNAADCFNSREQHARRSPWRAFAYPFDETRQDRSCSLMFPLYSFILGYWIRLFAVLLYSPINFRSAADLALIFRYIRIL